MSESTGSARVLNVELPAAAPQVRITAGLGSAAQKTWNLRRPITLIGSRRPAHIVLHDGDLSPAHCVIINTGTEVILKDLHTTGCTLCNSARIDLTLLKDGDVVTIGATKIQVAIHVPADTSEDSGCGIEYSDPLAFPTPVKVGLVHTDQEWKIKDAIALVGRHDDAQIHLDHEDVSRRHAVIFRFKDGPAVFDLGGNGGILVNGQRCALAPLSDGNRISVGPFALQIGPGNATRLDVQDHAVDHRDPSATSATTHETTGLSCDGAASYPVPDLDSVLRPAGSDGAAEPDAQLDAIQKGVAESWEQLNSWQAHLLDDAAALSKQEVDLAAREVSFEARDAALRGQLHDVERFKEQLAEREREIAAQTGQLQEEMDKLKEGQAACAQREEEISQRTADLSRREHVFAQRWTRLVSAKCAHCGQPVTNGERGPGPSSA